MQVVSMNSLAKVTGAPMVVDDVECACIFLLNTCFEIEIFQAPALVVAQTLELSNLLLFSQSE